jgi:hypothetical protein
MINISKSSSPKKNISYRYFLKIIIIIIIILVTLIYFNINNYNYTKVIKATFKFNLINKSNDRNILLEKFKLNHKNIMQGKSDLKLVFEGYTSGGYCNKLYSLITSLLISILTKSALVIRWNDIDKYIEEPLYLSFFKFNENNEFNAQYRRDMIYYPQPSKYAWKKYKNMDELVKTTIFENRNRTLYNSNRPFFFEICTNPIYYDVFLEFGLAKSETINKARNIFKNLTSSSNDLKMRVFLRIGFEVGGNILNYFWKPNRELQNLINYYYQTEFMGNYVIGLQIRVEFLQNNIQKNAYKNENQLYAEILKEFIKCASNLEANLTNNSYFIRKYKSIKWFVISDTMSIVNTLSSFYPKKVIKTNGTVSHVVKDPNGYFKAILENELLSKSDELILSSASSFGFVAALRKQIIPLNIDLINDKCFRTDFANLPNSGDAFLI